MPPQPQQPPPAIAIRPAVPEDIALLAAIDDDASRLYTLSGLTLNLNNNDAFIVDEQARWLESARRGRAYLAVDSNAPGDGQAVGFAALGEVDGLPYLDQLSVRLGAMRRGIGRRLLGVALDWARRQGGGALWLTTWDHLPYNRPFYEREGFVVVPETQCGPGVRHHLAEERAWLPAPEHRVAMRRAV
jgi:GNAT superfamily N-acetyltransferase